MAMEKLVWKLFLVGMIIAHGLDVYGVSAVERQDATAHENIMMGAFGLVCLWLVAMSPNNGWSGVLSV
jgi:uncharacterized membrane protein YozB (DUF420 family)